ncbi:MAG: WG repeat-containing protein [Clostridia bacterium]|nr:WG repeat-containing protein [Clostridia bacterium]
MNKIGSALQSLAALLLFALALLFIYAYASGMITDGSHEAPPVTEPGVEMPKKESELDIFLRSLSRSVSGNTVTDTYDADMMKLTLSSLDEFSLKSEHSLSKKTVKIPVRIPDEIFGTYTTELKESEADRVQIELYDGKLIVDRGTHLELYGDAGVNISDNFTLTPAYIRDDNGYALYSGTDGYYKVVENALVRSGHTKNLLERPIEYENTPDFANGGKGRYAVEKETEDGVRTALCDSDGLELTGYDYLRIFNFSEGLAAAVLPDGSISFIDKDGKVVIEGVHTYRNTSDRHVDRMYVLPDTFGAESIGQLYFDNGIAIVREKTVDYVYKENTISDTSAVIKSNGERLAVLPDYNIISASDGAVVVERNGRYGVFTADERWSLQPVYEKIEPFYEGLAVVKQGEKYALYDTSGNVVLPAIFDYISPVSMGKIIAYEQEMGFMLFEKQKIQG